ncbi:MAG: MXAN_5187 family protein [Myxococcaceae bacterium]
MRLKFLLFAVLVMGLWLGVLAVMSSTLGNALIDQGGRQVQAAAAAVARFEQRTAVATLAMAVQSAPPVLAAARRPGEGEKIFEAIKTAVSAAASENIRQELVVAYVTEGTSFSARGPSEKALEGMDYPALLKAGPDGAVSEVGSAQYQFVGVPLYPSAGESKSIGVAVVGLPLMPNGLPDQLAKRLGLSALVVLEGGKVIAEGGPDKGRKWPLTEMALGGVSVVERGGASSLGLVSLPILTKGDPLGGKSPLMIASRQALPGTPYEVLTVVSIKPVMAGLGQGQKVALLGLVVLLLLTVAWSFLMSGEEAPRRASATPTPEPVSPAAVRAPIAVEVTGSSALGTIDAPPPPEPNLDDFQFGSSGSASPPTPGAPPPKALAPASQPFELMPPVPDSALPPPLGASEADPYAQYDSDQVPTRAYAVTAGGDLSADPYADPFPPASGDSAEFNPDATRVASVPDELLAVARSQVAPLEQPAAPVPPPPRSAALTPLPPAQAAGNNDDAHFQDVFRDFVSTRERCGEAADGLTFDKFAVKLRKNREQLIQKYNCRTVRFQVYVKEGKAALKATPVKD